MFNDYALVASEETVSSLSDGLVQGKIAVCAVRDAVAEVHVVWPSDMGRLTRGLPIVPSMRGRDTAHLQFEEEMEALQAIEDAVREEALRLSFGPPSSFMEVRPVLTAGLALMFQEHGLDVRISARLHERLKWREGDQLAFAVSPDGGVGVLYCDEAGTSLTASPSDLGQLEVSSYLALPTRFADYSTEWHTTEYWISGGRIYFDMDQFAEMPASDSEPDETFDAAAFRPASSFLDSTIFHGAAAGSLATAMIALAFKAFS